MSKEQKKVHDNIWLCNYLTSDMGLSAQRARLVASFVLGGFNGKIHLADESFTNIPKHYELNYCFKASMLVDAYNDNCDIAIWSDSRMVLSQPFDALYKTLKEAPTIFLHKNEGWTVGQWTHDRCLKEFGVTREQAYEIPTVVSGFYAFDFMDKAAIEFFREFFEYCNRPEIINGPRYVGGIVNVNNKQYLGHRHDQSILSLMAHKYKLPLEVGHYADTTNAAGLPEEMRMNKTESTLFEWLP